MTDDVALKKINAVFQPGKLAAKHDEIVGLRASGDTMVFEGAVNWSVTLPSAEKRMKGEAVSLDQAFSDMAACLYFLSETYADDAEVICAVSLADNADGR